MDDIPLEDEPFEPFDDYEDYDDLMMQEAQRQSLLMTTNAGTTNLASASTSTSAAGAPTSTSTTAATSTGAAFKNPISDSDALPQQRDFLGLLQNQNQQSEAELQRLEQQRQQQQKQQQQQQQQQKRSNWKNKKADRPIGSTGAGGGEDGAAGDLGAVKVAKKRTKLATLDNERLMSDHGLSLLMSHGKRFKIRHKYKDSAEKNANAKNNLADLMRLYQTWAHNLFPKATFKDFITQAESKCRSDKQIRSTMNGWRDAYWKEISDKKEAAENAARAEQEAQDRMNGVWDEHAKEMEAQKSPPVPESEPLSDSQQPRSKLASSKKGKGKSLDNNRLASTAMRMAVSDDDDYDQDDYELALNRMRISMNLDNNDTKSSPKALSYNSRKTLGHDEDQNIFDVSHRLESNGRKNEIDLDNYNSDVEEEDEEQDAPLFTHRALKMMGGSKSSEIFSTGVPTVDTPTSRPEGFSLTNGVIDSDQEEIPSSSILDAATVELEPSFDLPTQPLDSFDDNDDTSNIKMEGLQRMDVVEDEDEDDTITRRKSTKGKRTILLDSSDDDE
ncbi:hypothetical protein BGZ49_003697 [Haplosporangium sp. Z 27]|nr:hypothetical protein BGZ49_003697 [Haplosporangium sp. Z 27]